jgi:sensor histidine kinase regulating citrate/malate metabolism
VSLAGSVLLTAAVASDDVLLDVYDSGPGLPGEIQNEHRVFRRHVSTRGAARGAGLYLARRAALAVDGELDLIARHSGHPAFPGAHFRLVLPAV